MELVEGVLPSRIPFLSRLLADSPAQELRALVNRSIAKFQARGQFRSVSVSVSVDFSFRWELSSTSPSLSKAKP